MKVNLDNKEMELLKPYRNTTTERLYKYLKQFCANKTKVFPKQDYLAKQMGVSPITIKRAVGNLKQLGVLGVDKKWKINQYTIQEGNAPVAKPQVVQNEVRVSSQEIEMLKGKIERLEREKQELERVLSERNSKLQDKEKYYDNYTQRTSQFFSILTDNGFFLPGTWEYNELQRLKKGLNKLSGQPQQTPKIPEFQQTLQAQYRDFTQDVDSGDGWDLDRIF